MKIGIQEKHENKDPTEQTNAYRAWEFIGIKNTMFEGVDRVRKHS